MTLAYFMQTAGSEVFRKRDVVVVDEAHGLAEWAEMYAAIQLGPRTVPFWDELRVPRWTPSSEPSRYAESLAQTCTRRKDDLLEQDPLSPPRCANATACRNSSANSSGSFRFPGPTEPDDVAGRSVRVARSRRRRRRQRCRRRRTAGRSLTIKPMNPEKYLQHTVWDRGK